MVRNLWKSPVNREEIKKESSRPRPPPTRDGEADPRRLGLRFPGTKSIVVTMPSSPRFVTSARLIALLTMVSRLLGLVREQLLAFFFSTSGLLSAFRIAFMVPNLARRLFGEGALSAALIPTLTESLNADGEERSRRLVGTLLVLLIGVLSFAVLVAEGVIAVVRSFQDSTVLRLTAVLLPFMVLICAVAVIGGVLNVRRHFAIPAATPVLLNCMMIACLTVGGLIVKLEPGTLMTVLCVGIVVAGVVQLAVGIVALRAVSFFPIFGLHWRDPRIRAVVRLMGPMVLGLSAVQLSTLGDYLIAYFFVTVDGEAAGPAILGFAQYLYQLPLGVFGIALATAIFPELSRKAEAGEMADVGETLSRGLRLAVFIALPSTVGLMFVARPLVEAVLEHGAFGPRDSLRVSATLFFYCIGLVAYFSQHLLVRTFYALKDSGTPARIAGVMVLANLAANFCLVFVMEERGLALATSLTAIVQVVWLVRRLGRTPVAVEWRGVGKAVGQAAGASVCLAGVLTVLMHPALGGGWLSDDPILRLVLLVVSGAATYGLAAKVLGSEELGIVLRRRGG